MLREIARAMVEFAEADGNALATAEALRRHREATAEIIGRAYGGLFREIGNDISRYGPKASLGIFWETKFSDHFDAVARDWITNMVASKVTPIARTTQRDAVSIVRAATLRGWSEGLGTDAIGALIRGEIVARAGVISRTRAHTIARTETHTAAQVASHEAAGSLGLSLKKQWVAADDERTRMTHSQADGQIVDHNDYFTVGGYKCQYPGDISLPAEEVINCRCASISIVED